MHLDDDAVEALVFLPLDGAGALDPLDQHLDVAVGQLQALDDVGDAAHREDVGRLRVVDRRVVLRGEEDPLVLDERVLERARRRRPPDDERHHHVREDDDVAERNDRESFVEFHVGLVMQIAELSACQLPASEIRVPTASLTAGRSNRQRCRQLAAIRLSRSA